MKIRLFVAIALTLTTSRASSFGQNLSEAELSSAVQAMKVIQQDTKLFATEPLCAGQRIRALDNPSRIPRAVCV